MNKFEEVTEAISKLPDSSEQVGELLGSCIKDTSVKPEEYNTLLLTAKQKGFKFGKNLVVPN